MSYVLYVFGKCCEIDEIDKLPSTNTELFEYQIRRHEKKKKTLLNYYSIFFLAFLNGI